MSDSLTRFVSLRKDELDREEQSQYMQRPDELMGLPLEELDRLESGVQNMPIEKAASLLARSTAPMLLPTGTYGGGYSAEEAALFRSMNSATHTAKQASVTGITAGALARLFGKG